MVGFVEGVDRGQSTLFPALLDDYVAEDNPVRAVDVFVEALELRADSARCRPLFRNDLAHCSDLMSPAIPG